MRQNTEMNREQALGKAAALCSASEHCTSQIWDKLASWGVAEDEANDLIGRLVEEKFIDNRRFARASCHDKFCYSPWGRVKIRQMLRHLRLSDEEMAEGMAAIPEEEYPETLTDALRAKDRTLKDTDTYQRKGKLVRHLLSRGFEMELVLDAVNEYCNAASR